MEHLTNDNYKEKIREGLVIVDFFADWCGPCKSFAPIFEQTVEKFPDVKFFKVDIEKAPDVASAFAVMSIPTIIFFKDGEKVELKMGMMMASQFESTIKSVFGL